MNGSPLREVKPGPPNLRTVRPGSTEPRRALLADRNLGVDPVSGTTGYTSESKTLWVGTSEGSGLRPGRGTTGG